MSRHSYEIELSGKPYACRTTFEAIQAFEEKADMSIIEAWNTLAEGKIKFSIVAIAVWAGINGERQYQGMKPLIFNTVGQLVQEHGFIEAGIFASKFFASALPVKGDKVEDPDAATEKKSFE